jgi:hypothetical protein
MPRPLIPTEILGQIPDLRGRSAYGPAAVAYVKLVAAWEGRRWYVTHYDSTDGLLWTKYVGPEGAAFMGVHLEMLEQMCGPNGERVERDDSFTPSLLVECDPELTAFTVRAEQSL